MDFVEACKVQIAPVEKVNGARFEEELVEEGEEEGVEVVARGGEAAFCFCYKLFFSFFSLRLVFFVCLSLLYLSLSPSCSLSKI